MWETSSLYSISFITRTIIKWWIPSSENNVSFTFIFVFHKYLIKILFITLLQFLESFFFLGKKLKFIIRRENLHFVYIECTIEG
jgi:hypothetical protein